MLPATLIKALGEGVATIWGTLPPAVQHDVFEAAVGSIGEQARESLATFLHDHHPRTAQDKSGRDIREPDSLGD